MSAATTPAAIVTSFSSSFLKELVLAEACIEVSSTAVFAAIFNVPPEVISAGEAILTLAPLFSLAITTDAPAENKLSSGDFSVPSLPFKKDNLSVTPAGIIPLAAPTMPSTCAACIKAAVACAFALLMPIELSAVTVLSEIVLSALMLTSLPPLILPATLTVAELSSPT